MAAGPGVRRAAPRRRRLRDLPQPRLRPAADGLRPAPGRRHLRARPRRHHRHRRRLAQRHVGHDDQLRRAGAAARRPARRRRRSRAAAARGASTSPTPRRSSASPRATVADADRRACAAVGHRRRARRARRPATGRPAARRRRLDGRHGAGRRREARRRRACGSRVVDPRWVLPVSDDLVELARAAGAVAVVEDNLVVGGVGVAGRRSPCARPGSTTPVHLHGIPKEFLEHASRGQVLEQIGLTADSIATALAAVLPG